jgi:hypothetical protein
MCADVHVVLVLCCTSLYECLLSWIDSVFYSVYVSLSGGQILHCFEYWVVDVNICVTGKTGQTFYTRYKEHIHAIRNNNSNSGYSNRTHIWDYN